jgi:hypothetical protein
MKLLLAFIISFSAMAATPNLDVKIESGDGYYVSLIVVNKETTDVTCSYELAWREDLMSQSYERGTFKLQPDGAFAKFYNSKTGGMVSHTKVQFDCE